MLPIFHSIIILRSIEVNYEGSEIFFSFFKLSPITYNRADVITGPDGRSKGFGIVEYGSANDARTAIDRLNETELKGRVIFVREDREGERSGSGAGGSASGGGGRSFSAVSGGSRGARFLSIFVM